MTGIGSARNAAASRERRRSARSFRAQHQTPAVEPVNRQRPAADLTAGRLQLDIGDCRRARGDGRQEAIAKRLDLPDIARQQPQGGEPQPQTVGVGVEPEHRLERCQPALVEPQRPLQRIAVELADEFGAADDDAGLRPAEQLVAAEGHQIGAGVERLHRRRLARQAVFGEVDERPAAEVYGEGQAVAVGEFGQFGFADGRREALDRIVGGMHLHQHRRARADGGREIGKVGPVRRADLDQLAARARHDIRHAEGAADLDQLAARHRHLPPAPPAY
jgi:hypothetical protein